MSRNNRKALIRTFEPLAAVVVLANLVVYFALIAGLGNHVRAAQLERENLFGQVRNQKDRIARLEKFQASLPDAKLLLAQFEKERVPSRRQGFSRAARLVREVAGQSGVQLSGVAYKLDSEGHEPLERLRITMTAEGPFSSLVNFAHALETAGDFLIVREFNFRPGETGDLALRMDADMYLAR